MIYYTYAHYEADTLKLFYIGKGQNKRAFSKDNRTLHWKNKVAKHGLKIEILARFETEKEALSHEIFLIDTLNSLNNNLINLTKGGEGISGFKFSEESKEKLRKAMTGRKASEETKQKMREKSVSKETGRLISKALKGRKHSLETRAKIAEANRNRKTKEQA